MIVNLKLKLLLPLLLFLGLLSPSILKAQTYTTVTGNVNDSSGNPYALGSFTIEFVPGTGTSANVRLPPGLIQRQLGTLSTLGALPSMLLVDNNSLATAFGMTGSTWRYTICAADRITCFTTTITITGGSQSVTSTLASAATAIPPLSILSQILFPTETAAPSTPVSGFFKFYFKSGGVYYKDSSGTESNLLTSSTGISGTPFAALTDGATVTWAIGSKFIDNKTLLFTTHGGSRTLNITGATNGGSYVLILTQDGTGGEGLTLGTGCTWKISGGGTGAVTPSTGAGAKDALAFTYDGTNCYANFNTNFN